MKKIISLALCFLFLVTSVSASPFLVCDFYPAGDSQPDQFSLVIDEGAPIISAAEVVDGKARLHYDLAGISPGHHSVFVKAINSLWGLESPAVPFEFTRPAGVTSPAVIGLVK